MYNWQSWTDDHKTLIFILCVFIEKNKFTCVLKHLLNSFFQDVLLEHIEKTKITFIIMSYAFDNSFNII